MHSPRKAIADANRNANRRHRLLATELLAILWNASLIFAGAVILEAAAHLPK